MKKLSVFKASAILILSSAMVMSLVTSCEGPEGVAGVDANETCKQCHNGESVLIAKINQAANSQHQLGITSFENASSCAPCHTSQGFIEALANDTTATVAAISNPVAINCRTCHDIHKEYDSTDFALRSEAPVKLRLIAETLDLGGPSNLCANCHQPRSVAVYPVAGGANISVTSSRLPGHYGTQSTMLAGMAGYEVAGSADYPSAANPHKLQDVLHATWLNRLVHSQVVIHSEWKMKKKVQTLQVVLLATPVQKISTLTALRLILLRFLQI